MWFLKHIYYTLWMKSIMHSDGYSLKDCWILVGEMLEEEANDEK